MQGFKAKNTNPSGKRSIVFNPKDGFKDLPVELPCGKCAGCKMSKAQEWALRCYHESTLHSENCFVTLTYRDADLPDDDSLDVDVLQRFIKRLRKEIYPVKIRHFSCGEYGAKKERPHYHLAIFGWEPKDVYNDRVTGSGNIVFQSKILEKLWPYGYITVGELSKASAGYIARYTVKKQTGVKKYYYENEYGEMVEKFPEFGIMSRRPGIGYEWFEKYWKDCRKDFLMHEGKKVPVPKYYRNLMERYHEQVEKKNRRKRKRDMDIQKEKGEMDQRRLEAKEKCLKDSMSRLKRSAENA